MEKYSFKYLYKLWLTPLNGRGLAVETDFFPLVPEEEEENDKEHWDNLTISECEVKLIQGLSLSSFHLTTKVDGLITRIPNHFFDECLIQVKVIEFDPEKNVPKTNVKYSNRL